MLSQILEELRQSTEPVNGDDLARRLGIEQNALEGMLNQLVSQGKLRKVRQMGLNECRQEIEAGKLSLYGDLCAFIGTADSVVHYEIVPEE
jgi:Mn-dependent DtxR family transcriptional regulator